MIPSLRLVITSGYYAPLHVGHCVYLAEAATLGDYHIAIVNNDKQVTIKGSKPFMNEADRRAIVASIKRVDTAMLSIDEDGSQCATLEKLVTENRGQFSSFIFAKGGDRHAGNIPEKEVCDRLGIKIVDGLGAKIRASSDILAKWEVSS